MGLCMAAQKGPFVMKYYVVLSPKAPQHLCVLPQGGGQKQTERWRREKKRVEHKERVDETRETLSYVMLTVVKGGEI